jgi:MFS family permease
VNVVAELKRHPRPLWVLFFATLVNRLGLMVLPFLALYLTSVLHYSTAQAGILVGAYGLGGLFINLFGSSLGDRFGIARVTTVALAGAGILLLLLPQVDGYAALLVAVPLWSFFSETVRTSSFAAVGQYSDPALLKSAFAIQRLAINLGASVGPVIGGLLAHDHFEWLFYIDGGTSLVAAFLLYRFLPSGGAPVQEREASAVTMLTATFRALADRRLLAINLILLPIILCYAQLDSSFPLFVVGELGHSERFYGFLYCINAVVVTLIEVPLTIRMNDTPLQKTVVLGGLCFAAGMGLFAFGVPPALVLGILMLTVGEMVVLPSSSAYISEIAPAGKRSAYMGVQFSVWSFASIVGPMAGTWVLARYGAAILWLGLMGIATITALGARAFLPRRAAVVANASTG